MTAEERDKYLKTECLHPIRVVNKYTHETIFTRCGTCPSCLAFKSNLYCSLISNMASHFKYAYFFTLTYSDEFLPKVSIEVGERINADCEFDAYCVDSDIRNYDPSDTEAYLIRANYISRSGRFRVSASKGRTRNFDNTEEPFQFDFICKPSEIQDVLIKSNGEYDFSRRKVVYPSLKDCSLEISVLNPYDQNLFFKRLRRKLEKVSDEKISYYLVSEYGPRTLRPHWHGILFFNSDKISEVICEYVSTCWAYGRTDCSLSRGSAAGYVASYINSFVSLPPFFKGSKKIRPRSYHSKGFGVNSSFPKSADVSQIEDVSDKLFDGFNIPSDGTTIKVRPTRSYERIVFPRFFDPIFKDSYSCVNLYFGAYSASFRLIRNGYLSIDEQVSTFELAKRYATFYYDSVLNSNLNRFKEYYDDLIFDYIRLNTVQIAYDFVVGKVYRLFMLVNRTFKFWRLTDYFGSELKQRLDLIFKYSDLYWSRCDQRTLSNYFEYLENDPLSHEFLYCRTVGFDRESALEDVEDSETGEKKESEFKRKATQFEKYLRSCVKDKLMNKIKHKEFNDAQGLLFNL